MPIQIINGLQILVADDSYADKYWPQVTGLIREKHGNEKIVQPEVVQQALMDCFNFLCEKFMQQIHAETRASFFLFVHHIHEDSVEIWQSQLNGPQWPINQGDFISLRRVMKCILEQGCTLDIVGHPFLLAEIGQNLALYTQHLDELFYLGSMAMEIADFISRSCLGPHSIYLEIQEGLFTRLTTQPFDTIIKWFRADYDRHAANVEIDQNIAEFKQVFTEQLNANFDQLVDFAHIQSVQPEYRFAIIKPAVAISQKVQQGFNEDFLITFFAGLVLSRNSTLSFSDSLVKTQNENRIIYRPFLEYIIDGDRYWIVGGKRFYESIVQVCTNCFPFGQSPSEWLQIPPLKKFYEKRRYLHDKILEDAAVLLLENRNVIHDRTIKVIKRLDNRNISIDKMKGVGEIDLLFLDTVNKTIFVAECKHNRARYELYNWLSECKLFREKYEGQLNNKCQWVFENKQLVLTHLELAENINIDGKEEYSVQPIFVINAPNLYMHDSDYPVFTLNDLRLFLDGEHQTISFNGEIHGHAVEIFKPYFQNTERLWNELAPPEG